ncbi:histone H4 transcription factor-like [Anopheles aquasalis]|uniref:histone H4 transcription factor-like n=1 Tax=Anopheles aquasalis TaxID=42839 RepID=UPI00215A1D16|nr:histone H4 transcription factor-like [Anopheles aquasalis]
MGKGKKRRVNDEIKVDDAASDSGKTKPSTAECMYQQLTDDDPKDLQADGVEEDASDDATKALPIHMELRVIDALNKFSMEERRHSSQSRCEWNGCTFRSRNDPEYISHVEGHANTEERNQYGNFVCTWDGCDYLTPKSEQFLSHLHFHGYHGQLKAHGRSVHKLIDIPVCKSDTDKRNMISDQPTSFQCEWDGCESRFIRILDFFTHVVNHANEEYKRNREDNSARCRWKNCNYKLLLKTCRYRNHVASHTKQKDIACNVCGTMVINPRRYLLHVCRLMDLSLRRHQCLQCGRYYATKTMLDMHLYLVHRPAKLLCTHCPAKFRWPFQRAQHIARRHKKDLPFICDQCEYRGRTERDVTLHAQRHKEVFRCTEVECNKAFNSKSSLREHLLQHYDIRPKVFECHLCQQQYRFGAHLSKHMFFSHKGKRDTNAIPLRFKRDTDGIFRLRSYVDSKTDRLT